MKLFQYILLGSLGILLVTHFSACQSSLTDTRDSDQLDSAKIVSINGTVSEILVDLGYEDNIVGVDVASTYPTRLQSKPKVGHSKQLTAEGILALSPDIIVGTTEDLKPDVSDQLRQSGVRLLLFDHPYTVEGTKTLIQTMADSLHRKQQGDSLIQVLESDFAQIADLPKLDPKPKVLFIYARGSGTMMVAGTGTQMDEMIRLAGGENAVTGFSEFKPLTAEALVAANPDVILLFDSGLSSLGGASGLMQVQGIAETNAGKNKRFVEMDGQFLAGFSQRLGKAVLELAQKIHAVEEVK